MIQKDYTDSFILNALNLPTISDLDSLSDALAISKRLIFLLTKKTENYYKRLVYKVSSTLLIIVQEKCNCLKFYFKSDRN